MFRPGFWVQLLPMPLSSSCTIIFQQYNPEQSVHKYKLCQEDFGRVRPCQGPQVSLLLKSRWRGKTVHCFFTTMGLLLNSIGLLVMLH